MKQIRSISKSVRSIFWIFAVLVHWLNLRRFIFSLTFKTKDSYISLTCITRTQLAATKIANQFQHTLPVCLQNFLFVLFLIISFNYHAYFFTCVWKLKFNFSSQDSVCDFHGKCKHKKRMSRPSFLKVKSNNYWFNYCNSL